MLSRCTGLEIDCRNYMGFTALMKAALQGRTKCAKLLLFAGQLTPFYINIEYIYEVGISLIGSGLSLDRNNRFGSWSCF